MFVIVYNKLYNSVHAYNGLINRKPVRSTLRQGIITYGVVHKVRHAIFDDFEPPPSPLSQTVTNLRPPPPKVRHTLELKNCSKINN